MHKHIIPMILVTTLLSACNGGSGSDDEKDKPLDTLTGVFVDSPVAGLQYKTKTQSGLTNELGEFEYVEGESITFYLGDTELGVTLGTSEITPFSLFGLTPLSTEFEISDALSGSDVNSYDRAINVATLLQTFDVDGSPENGIDLGSSHSTLKNHKVSLHTKARNFELQTDFTHAKTIVGSTSNITFGSAIQHMYNSLDITITSSLTATFISTQNKEQLEAVSFEYDANGNLTTENTDSDNNGEIDTSKTFSYGSNGKVSRITNSKSNTTETLSYDEQDNINARTTESGSGNTTRENYHYTNNKLARFELDLEDNGSIEKITHYFYNDNGDITHYQVDNNGDGIINSIANYTYLNAILSTFTEDSNNDDAPNIQIQYTYDNEGNKTAQTSEFDPDGSVISISTFTYDNQNNPLRYEQDRDMDGSVDYAELYTYDSNNQRTQYQRDMDGNGSWDFVAQYVYDINGQRIKMIEDSDGNGIVDNVWTGEYQPAVLENTWDVILSKL